jgi:hypothetical protein
MSDDRPWAEFEAPKLVYNTQVPDTLALMQPNLTPLSKMLVVDSLLQDQKEALIQRHKSHLHDFEGLRLYYGGMLLGDDIANAFIASLEIDDQNLNARYYLKDILLRQVPLMIRWDQLEEAHGLMDKAIKFMPDDHELLELKEELERASGGKG